MRSAHRGTSFVVGQDSDAPPLDPRRTAWGSGRSRLEQVRARGRACRQPDIVLIGEGDVARGGGDFGQEPEIVRLKAPSRTRDEPDASSGVGRGETADDLGAVVARTIVRDHDRPVFMALRGDGGELAFEKGAAPSRTPISTHTCRGAGRRDRRRAMPGRCRQERLVEVQRTISPGNRRSRFNLPVNRLLPRYLASDAVGRAHSSLRSGARAILGQGS